MFQNLETIGQILRCLIKKKFHLALYQPELVFQYSVIFLKHILKLHPCEYILYVRNEESVSLNVGTLINVLVSILE